jgi:hypothetical protein
VMPRYQPTFTMPFEIERAGESVDLECDFTVSPGCPERGPTYDCGGTPAEPPEVAEKSVFLVRVKRCRHHQFTRKGRETCLDCKRTRLPLPEFDDLVSDDELMEFAGEYGGPDDSDAYDRARDDRMEG